MQETGMNLVTVNTPFWAQMANTLFIVFFLYILFQLVKYLTTFPSTISMIEDQIKTIDLKLEEVRNKL